MRQLLKALLTVLSLASFSEIIAQQKYELSFGAGITYPAATKADADNFNNLVQIPFGYVAMDRNFYSGKFIGKLGLGISSHGYKTEIFNRISSYIALDGQIRIGAAYIGFSPIEISATLLVGTRMLAFGSGIGSLKDRTPVDIGINGDLEYKLGYRLKPNLVLAVGYRYSLNNIESTFFSDPKIDPVHFNYEHYFIGTTFALWPKK